MHCPGPSDGGSKRKTRARRSGPRSPRPASAVEPASAPPPSHRSRAMAISAREFRKEHARRAAQAVSTVLVRDIEQESAHEMAIRSALVPMGTVKEVNLMLLEGDRQSWALVTFANETSAQRSTSRAQRKGYGCTVAVRWSVRMVPAAEMLRRIFAVPWAGAAGRAPHFTRGPR